MCNYCNTCLVTTQRAAAQSSIARPTTIPNHWCSPITHTHSFIYVGCHTNYEANHRPIRHFRFIRPRQLRVLCTRDRPCVARPRRVDLQLYLSTASERWVAQRAIVDLVFIYIYIVLSVGDFPFAATQIKTSAVRSPINVTSYMWTHWCWYLDFLLKTTNYGISPQYCARVI